MLRCRAPCFSFNPRHHCRFQAAFARLFHKRKGSLKTTSHPHAMLSVAFAFAACAAVCCLDGFQAALIGARGSCAALRASRRLHCHRQSNGAKRCLRRCADVADGFFGAPLLAPVPNAAQMLALLRFA